MQVSVLLAKPQFQDQLTHVNDCGDIQVPQALVGSKVFAIRHQAILKLHLLQSLNLAADALRVRLRDDLSDLVLGVPLALSRSGGTA